MVSRLLISVSFGLTFVHGATYAQNKAHTVKQDGIELEEEASKTPVELLAETIEESFESLIESFSADITRTESKQNVNW
jgi:hypothetical protein